MDPPYWQTAGYGVDFPFENYERMADFMRRCKGKVMVSINDHPDIRRVFGGFHFETLDIRYTTANQRLGKAEVSGELLIMNWQPDDFGGLFLIRPKRQGIVAAVSFWDRRLNRCNKLCTRQNFTQWAINF
nr:hypothetical protein GCM10020185_04770 [Pseudomonas brassicacearum subsp. brassicacearum]